jgi:membrane protein implicated in regulation of membrane protease activity
MSYVINASKHPLMLGFSAYVCAHAMLFSLIGMLALPLPGVWWAALGLIPCWLLMRWLQRFERADLAQLVGVSATAFTGGVMGIHGRDLFCFFRALV